MFWKNQAFKTLQNEWYAALEEDGFMDIEHEIGFEEKLKQNANWAYRHSQSPIDRHGQLEYYLALAHAVSEHASEFDDDIDYFVMYKFATGCKNSEICKQLEKLGKPRHRKTIMFIRRKYELKWGIRAWKPEQLKSKRSQSSK